MKFRSVVSDDEAPVLDIETVCKYNFIVTAQLARVVEYTDCISAEE